MRPVKDHEVFVVDLDGTLIPYNSFHRWLLHLLKRGAPGARMEARIFVLREILRRLTGSGSHQDMKLGVMRLWREAIVRAPEMAAAQSARFASRTQSDFRADLMELLLDARVRGVPCILATAAPDDYAHALADSGLFDSVLASRVVGDVLDENRFEKKLANVRAEMSRRGWQGRAIALATDHGDDQPLCAESCFVYWYGTEESWTELRNGLGSITGEMRSLARSRRALPTQ